MKKRRIGAEIWSRHRKVNWREWTVAAKRIRRRLENVLRRRKERAEIREEIR